MKRFILFSRYFFLLPFSLILWSCTEDTPEPEVNCTDSTLALMAEVTQMSNCLSTNGAIVATGSGGEGTFMYSLNDGPFQANQEFEDLSPGKYRVNVADDSECVFTVQVTINSGISFSAEIQPIIENSCALDGCHNGSSDLPNFNIFSNFQSRAENAKSRTQSGDMPRTGSLTAAEIAKIACWVDDGAKDN